MKTIFSLFVGAALLASSGAALAQGRGPAASVTRDQAVAQADQRFARMDANRDGRVTADERSQVRLGRRADRQAQLFARLDTDRNGSLSQAEFAARQALRAERRAERGERRGNRRGMRAERRQARLLGADGVITRDEFRARAAQRFERLDANRDGTVTLAERSDSRQRLRQQRMERRQQRN